MQKAWKVICAFINKRSVFVGVLVVSIFVVLSFGSVVGVHIGPLNSTRASITYDEVSHIASAYYYDHEHAYYLNPEHPPLVKVVAGIPLQFLSLKPGKLDPKILTREDNQWNYGHSFLFVENKEHTDRIVSAARLAVLFFNATLLFAIFILLYRLLSKRAALIALSFIAFNPVILGHASLVTFDVPAALSMTLCLLSFAYYLKIPSLKRTLLVAITLAVALLSKFSTVFVLPVIILAAVTWLVLIHANLKQWLQITWHGLVIAALALFLVTTFMLPLTIHTSTVGMQQQFDNNWPGHLKNYQPHLLSSLIKYGSYPKALAAWLNGFWIIQNVVESGKSGTIFLGKLHYAEGPGPYYYPVLFITKLPFAAVLFAVSMPLYLLYYMSRRFRLYKAVLKSPAATLYLLFFICCGAYFIFVTVQPFKIGMRHFFPFVIGSLVLTAAIIDRHWNAKIILTKLRLSRVYIATLALIILSTLMSFPYYISYYNILAGGTRNGYKIAVDSNYDWGQDLIRLRKWKDTNHVDTLYTDLFVNPFGVEAHYLGATQQVDSMKDIGKIPTGSYVAVSANQLEMREAINKKTYAQLYNSPVERLSTTIFIFRK